jgi:hypothetical protein
MLRRNLLGLASLVIVLLPAIALTSEPTTLKAIMQGLRESLIVISDGLLKDNFDQIARGAAEIANHPKIPAEQVQLVAQELGPEMATFKQLDLNVHNLSLEIVAAAKAQDRDAALASYQQLIEGCFECHHAYEERIATVLAKAD